MFECVWGGKRHAMIGPTQIDRWGQTNLSAVGDYAKPKSAVLGSLERFAFYDRVRRAFAVVATGERRLYGNILLKKGVVRTV